MKLREALKSIVKEGDAGFIRSPFCLYAKLADLIGADYCERDGLKLLFEMDRRLSLVRRLMENDIAEVARIREEFSSLQDVCSKAEFDEIVDAVASVLIKGYAPTAPDEPDDFDFGFSDRPEEEATAEQSVEDCINDKTKLARFTVVQLRKYCRERGIRGYSSLNKTELIDLIMGRKRRAQALSSSQASYSSTSSPSYYKWYWGIDFWDILPWFGGALGIAILIAGAVCLGIFADKIQWFQWQYIIGSVGGLVVCGVGFLLALAIGWFLNEIIVTGFDGYRMAIPIVIAPLAIANFVLMFVFGEAYSIIFYWMSGYLLLASVIGTIYSFTDYETTSGIFGIIDAVVLVGMLAVRILMQVL